MYYLEMKKYNEIEDFFLLLCSLFKQYLTAVIEDIHDYFNMNGQMDVFNNYIVENNPYIVKNMVWFQCNSA